MRRRDFITGIAGSAAAWPLAARAQQPKRIGVLVLVSKDDTEFQRRVTVLRQALADLGWTEKNVAFEVRFADGEPDRLPTLAAELVRAKPDVIVTQGTLPTEALRNATSTIAIVMASIGDAVGIGIVPSLSQPGGNITGLTLVATEQSTRRLQLIKEVSPAVARAAVLWSANNASHRLQLKEMETAVPILGLRLQSVPLRDAGELDAAFQAMQTTAQAVVTMDDPLINSLRARIVAFAMRQKLPLMGEFRPMTAAGGLMNYGPNQIEMWRRVAVYVDKILKGAKPGDLPIERPTKFELVINLKTARALGLEIPPTLLALADEVIE